MNKKWNEKTTFEKTLDIISGIALFVWLLFEYLERSNNIEYANFIDYIAVSVICVCNAISFWNVKRALSYVAIFGVICMIAVAVMDIMLHV